MKNIILISSALIVLGIVFFSFSFVTITGFSIAQELGVNVPPLMGMIFLFSGILLFLGQDALQAHLQRKERISPSPSLYHHKPTLKDHIKFKTRGMLGSLVVSKPKEYHEEQKEPLSEPYGPHTNLPSGEERVRIFNDYNRRKTNREILVRDAPILRKGIAKEFKKLNEAVEERDMPDPSRINVHSVLNQIEDLYKSAGLEFSRERYNELIRSKNKAVLFKVRDNLIKYLKSNERAVSEDELNARVNNLVAWGKEADVKRGDVEILNPHKMYVEEAKTVSVSDTSKKHDVHFVHALPFTKVGGQYKQFGNNRFWLKQGRQAHELKPLDFVYKIESDKPALSASTVSKRDQHNNFFASSPVGIIIDEGKIYDASSYDSGTKTHADNPKIRMRYGSPAISEGSLERRVSNSIVHRHNNEHNEFVIGGNYHIGGVYFVKNSPAWEKDQEKKSNPKPYDPEVVREFAKYSIDKGVKFYEFRPSEGFVEANPHDYLHAAIPPAVSDKQVRKTKSRVKSK